MGCECSSECGARAGEGALLNAAQEPQPEPHPDVEAPGSFRVTAQDQEKLRMWDHYGFAVSKVTVYFQNMRKSCSFGPSQSDDDPEPVNSWLHHQGVLLDIVSPIGKLVHFLLLDWGCNGLEFHVYEEQGPKIVGEMREHPVLLLDGSIKRLLAFLKELTGRKYGVFDFNCQHFASMLKHHLDGRPSQPHAGRGEGDQSFFPSVPSCTLKPPGKKASNSGTEP